ncbi:MAG: CsbD family protein [Bacteroidetes bacterium]|nr:hypothetical protein AWN76_012290 [Rhodothermaceae bacterium RA]RMH50919.1 MAG: CsbD family protein [Bacteroidota bacterium]
MTDAIQEQIDAKWTQFKGRLKEAYGALTDSDLDRFEGRRDQLVGYLSETTGEVREQIEEKINAWLDGTGYTFERK